MNNRVERVLKKDQYLKAIEGTNASRAADISNIEIDRSTSVDTLCTKIDSIGIDKVVLEENNPNNGF